MPSEWDFSKGRVRQEWILMFELVMSRERQLPRHFQCSF